MVRAYSWLCAFGVFLLPPVLVRYVGELRGAGAMRQARLLLAACLRIQSFIAILVVILGFPVLLASNLVLGIDHTTAALLVVAFVAYAFGQLYDAWLRGTGDFSRLAIASGLGSALRIVAIGVLWISGATVPLALFVLLLGNAAFLGFAWWFSRPVATDDPRRGRVEVRGLRKRLADYAANMGVAGFLSLVIWNYIEVFLLAGFQTDASLLAHELALYTTAIAIAALPMRVGKTISGALLPTFSALYGAKDHTRIRRGYFQATILATASGGFFSILLLANVAPAFRLLFPESLHAAVPLLNLLLIPSIFLAINHAGGALQLALEGHRYALAAIATLACVNIALDIALIPDHGAIGAATVNAIVQSAAVCSTIVYIAFRRRIGFPFRRMALLLATQAFAASPGPIASFAGASDSAALAIGLGTSLLAYIALLRFTPILNDADRAAIRVALAGSPSAFRWIPRLIAGAPRP